MITYCPEMVKLEVNNEKVTGFISGDFIVGNQNQFKVNLHVGSDSIEYLTNHATINPKNYVELQSGVTKGEYVSGEYDPKHERVKHLDFSGWYKVEGPNFNYSLHNVEVSFVFTKVN